MVAEVVGDGTKMDVHASWFIFLDTYLLIMIVCIYRWTMVCFTIHFGVL